jgi:hypothetical protein
MSTEPKNEVEYEIEGGDPVDTALDIEVVDDTPASDKGRKPTEPPTDPSDDELASYSAGAKKRIQHFTKGYHDERRAKETAYRERDEAVRVAQHLVEEARKLQGSLVREQSALHAHAKTSIERDLEVAKKGVKEAQESFDVDSIVVANERLMDAKIRETQVKNYRPPTLQPIESVVQLPQERQNVDEKAQRWASRNSWFGSDPEMTGTAQGLHQKLVQQGVDPTSDEYYAKIDSRMRERFPESFDDGNTEPRARSQSNVVASASRSSTPKKVVLTQTQVSLARRLGLTVREYAEQVALEMKG